MGRRCPRLNLCVYLHCLYCTAGSNTEAETDPLWYVSGRAARIALSKCAISGAGSDSWNRCRIRGFMPESDAAGTIFWYTPIGRHTRMPSVASSKTPTPRHRSTSSGAFNIASIFQDGSTQSYITHDSRWGNLTHFVPNNIRYRTAHYQRGHAMSCTGCSRLAFVDRDGSMEGIF